MTDQLMTVIHWFELTDSVIDKWVVGGCLNCVWLLQWSRLCCIMQGVGQKLFCNYMIVGWCFGAFCYVHYSIFAWGAYDLSFRDVAGCCVDRMRCHW